MAGRNYFLAGLVIAPVLAFDPVLAQDILPQDILAKDLTSAQAAPRSGDDEIIALGFFTREDDISQRAASLAVIDRGALDNIGAVHASEALNGVAGVNIQRGSGQESLTAIRSPVLTGGAGAGSFLFLEDGVPLRAAGFANVNGLFEGGTEFAGQLSVFRGPGPVKFGSNAVHGLINIVPQAVRAPSSIRLLGNDDGFTGITAAHQFSDSSFGGLRLALTANHDNGFRDDSGYDQQKLQLHYQGQWGAWDISALGSFQNLNQETAGFLQDLDEDESPQGVAIEGLDLLRDPEIRFSNPNPEAFRDNRTYRLHARLGRDLAGGKRLELTSYARRVELEFLRHFVPGQALEINNHSSVGLQSTLYSQDWALGIDLDYSQGSLFEFQDNPTVFSFTQGLHYDYQVSSVTAAAYAQKDIRLGPKTVLDIGARADYTRYDYDNQNTVGRSGRFIRLADRRDDFFIITPKISLRHRINERLNLYARAARGARAPQVADLYSVQLNQSGGEARVETLDSLETGVKYYHGAAHFELAGFAQWKDGFFFRNSDGFSVANGQTRHLGVEASFLVPLTPWLELSGEGTIARHIYDFEDINFNFDGSIDAANTIMRGARVDTAPDTLAHMRLRLTPLPRISSEIEWRHVGQYFTDPGNTQSYNGHNIFVLRSSLDVTENLRIFARIDNLFDQIFADRADFAFGNQRFFPGRPQTLFFGLTSEF